MSVAGRRSAGAGDAERRIRDFYRGYHDSIRDKRLDSPYPLRRYVHRALQASTLEAVRPFVRPGCRILDAGCGEGSLLFAMVEAFARERPTLVGVDLSEPNLREGRRGAPVLPPGVRVELQAADLQALPFADASFDVVVSSHVLEHLPDFDRGLAEIRRVAKDVAILGLPTCLNPCSMVILGGDNYWTVSRRTPYAGWLGLARVVASLGKEGVDEGYVGRKELPHPWRYPWVLRRQIEQAGFEILRFEAATLAIPYLAALVPPLLRLQAWLDRFRAAPVLRNLGYGSIVVARKRPEAGGRSGRDAPAPGLA